MFTRLKNLLHFDFSEGDKTLVLITCAIVLFGLIMLCSASIVAGQEKVGDGYYFFKHQLYMVIAGIAAFLAASNFDYHRLKKLAPILLIASIVLLLLIFIPAFRPSWGTARSWINIFGFSLQPSELVKLTFILYLAAWLDARKGKLEKASEGILPFIVILGIIVILMLMQPDLGTLSVIAASSLIIYYVGGGKISHILTICALGAVAFLVLININDYQKERINCFLNPDSDRQGACFQINQALIAVGSGGVTGVGLGKSLQKFSYIPEPMNDSIFAIISEETGFIFSTALILLFFAFFWRGFIIAKNAPDDFGRLAALGISCWFILQTTLNIGGITNLLPMTGVPLPLVSYGGSAMVASLAAVGVLYNISKKNN